MNPEEITKKDWQLLTAYTGMTSLSYLQCILENQAIIISELTKKPLDSVIAQIEVSRKENYKSVLENVRKNIPDYKP